MSRVAHKMWFTARNADDFLSSIPDSNKDTTSIFTAVTMNGAIGAVL